MAGFGAYMLAGAASAAGEGLIERARALREERMTMLKRQWELDDRAAAEAQRASRGGGGGGGRRSSGGRRSGSGVTPAQENAAYQKAFAYAEDNAMSLGIDDSLDAYEAWARENLHRFDTRITAPETPVPPSVTDTAPTQPSVEETEPAPEAEPGFMQRDVGETVKGWMGFGQAAGMTEKEAPDAANEAPARPAAETPPPRRNAPQMETPAALSADEEADLVRQATGALAAGADPAAMLERLIASGVPQDVAQRIIDMAKAGG